MKNPPSCPTLFENSAQNLPSEVLSSDLFDFRDDSISISAEQIGEWKKLLYDVQKLGSNIKCMCMQSIVLIIIMLVRLIHAKG